MPRPRKVSDDQLQESYARTSNVWATGTELGIFGYFDSEEAAALARDAQAVKIAGEFAVLNFPVAGELTE